MGLALDEPSQADTVHTVDGLDFLVSPDDDRHLSRYGGLLIDHSSWGGLRVVTTSGRRSCC